MNKILQTIAINEEIDETSLLQYYFNQAQQYQVLLNKNFKVKSYNTYADSFTKKYYDIYLAKGFKIWQYITPSFSADYQQLAGKALSGEKVEYEIFLNKEDDTHVWFKFCIVPILNFNEKINGFMLIGNNITKQKDDEKVIRQQSEILSSLPNCNRIR